MGTVSFGRCLGGFVSLLAAVSLIAAPAQARREWPAPGHNGDYIVKAECPAGQVLVGFRGRTGARVDQIQLVCSPFQTYKGALLTEPSPYGEFYGSRGGGAPRIVICPKYSKMSSLGIELTKDGRLVAYLIVKCQDLNGGEKVLEFGDVYGKDTQSEDCGRFMGALLERCERFNAVTWQACPQEQFVGVTVKAGLDVAGVGAICDRRDPVPYKDPAAAAPPPPPPPKPRNPTEGREAVRTRPVAGKAISGKANSLLGEPWNVTSKQSFPPFKLILHRDEDNGADAYWGEMLFADSKSNGTLIGNMKGSEMHFTFEQVDAGTSGSGYIRAWGEKVMAGSLKIDGNPARNFELVGTR
jgi:hypothetical protein